MKIDALNSAVTVIKKIELLKNWNINTIHSSSYLQRIESLHILLPRELPESKSVL